MTRTPRIRPIHPRNPRFKLFFLRVFAPSRPSKRLSISGGTDSGLELARIFHPPAAVRLGGLSRDGARRGPERPRSMSDLPGVASRLIGPSLLSCQALRGAWVFSR